MVEGLEGWSVKGSAAQEVRYHYMEDVQRIVINLRQFLYLGFRD